MQCWKVKLSSSEGYIVHFSRVHLNVSDITIHYYFDISAWTLVPPSTLLLRTNISLNEFEWRMTSPHSKCSRLFTLLRRFLIAFFPQLVSSVIHLIKTHSPKELTTLAGSILFQLHIWYSYSAQSQIIGYVYVVGRGIYSFYYGAIKWEKERLPNTELTIMLIITYMWWPMHMGTFGYGPKE